MSSGWIKCANDIGDHRKAIDIHEDMYLACLGLWLVCTGWCDRHLTNGVIPKRAVKRIGGEWWQEPAAELVRVGFFEDSGDDFVLHDYLDWQTSAEEKTARSKAQRDRVKKRWDTAGNTNGNTAGNTNRNTDKTRLEENRKDKRENAREDEICEEKDPPSYANDLPSCLHLLKSGGVSAAALIMRTLDAKWCGNFSATDRGEFTAALVSGCLPGCDGNKKQAAWCAEHLLGDEREWPGIIERHASPAGWKASRLLAKALREDRRPAATTRRRT